MADNNEDLNINIGVNPGAAEQGSSRVSASIKKMSGESKRLDAAFRQLKSAIDPTFEAQEKFNNTLKDYLELLNLGKITESEFKAGKQEAKRVLEETTAAINKNTEAARAAAAELKRLKQLDAQAAKEAAVLERQAAREKAEAEKQAAREAAAAAKAAREIEKAAIREAAALAKQAAREKADAEKLAAQEAAEAAREAARATRTAAKQAADEAIRAAQQKREADRLSRKASEDAAEAVRRQAREEKKASEAAHELRASIDSSYAAQSRYNETMRKATQLLMMNKLQTGEWSRIQQQAKNQMDINTRSLGRMNSVYVQLGYQAQDVTASLASGIHPLVILAQQGGQTASALAQMGGKIGFVASQVAGPWGAAILGLITLIGLMATKTKKTKEETLDLINAEDLRKATLDKLTGALRDFNKEQERANINTEEALRLDGQRAKMGFDEAKRRLKKANDDKAAAEKELAAAQEAAKTATGKGGQELAAGRITSAASNLKKAVEDIKQATEAYNLANQAAQQVEVRKIRREAEAKVDPREKIKQTYEAEEAKLINIYNQKVKNLDPDKDQLKLQEEHRKLEEGLVKALKEREAAEEKLNNAKKDARDKKKQEKQELDNLIESLNYEQVQAGENYQKILEIQNKKIAALKAYYNKRNELARAPQPIEEGNIDIHNRPVVNNKDGTISTVKSMSIGTDKGEVLIPMVSMDGRVMTVEEAIEEYRKTGLNLGTFKSPKDANEYAKALHLEQEQEYSGAIKSQNDEITKALEERAKIEQKYGKQIAEQKQKDIQAQETMSRKAIETDRKLADTQNQIQEDIANFQQQHHFVSEGEAVNKKAQQLEQEYQQQINFENRMYNLKAESLRAQLRLEDLPLEIKNRINNELEQAEADHLDRMDQLNIQHTQGIVRMQLASANVTLNKWGQVTQTMTSSFNSAFQGLWTYSLTWQQALINMGDQLVFKFFDMGVRMVEDWALRQLGMTAVQQAQETARTVSTATANTAQTASTVAATTAQTTAQTTAATAEIAATTALETAKTGIFATAVGTRLAIALTTQAAMGPALVLSEAAIGAAAAWASIAAIPYVGPIIAPGVAAETYAGIAALAPLAVAERGWGEVPYDGAPASLHKKEMVLPAWIAEPLRQSLKSPGTSRGVFANAARAGDSVRNSNITNQGGNTFNYQPSHNNSNIDIETLLLKDQRQLRKWFQNEMRNGTIKVKK